MARGKRRAPIKPSAPSIEEISTNDEVDQFVSSRHKKMLEEIQADSSEEEELGTEPKSHERDVLNIDMSDSESQSDDEESSDSDGEIDEEFEERKGWGGKKKLWYGGDTHEYEIMEDDEREEALKDEEEEAVRLQNEFLSGMRPEDFRDEDDEETDAVVADGDEDDESIEPLGENADLNSEVLSTAAPEVPALFEEMLECRKQALIWKERVHWNEVARIIYHLHASFVSNVAFYLSMRTDPACAGTDLRTHPVLVQIVRIRSQLQEALALPCEEPQKSKQAVPVTPQARERPDKQKEAAKPHSSPKGSGNHLENKTNEGKQVRKKRKKRLRQGLDSEEKLDEEKLKELALAKNTGKDLVQKDLTETEQAQKRRRLNMLIGSMEREQKNSGSKRIMSADAETIREPAVQKIDKSAALSGNDVESDEVSPDDDDDVMRRMIAKKAKKEARKLRKAEEVKPHVYTFKDDVDPEARRRASSQVVKNRGLTRYRPKDKKTPRTKNRMAYSKAVVRRRGAVRDYSGTPGSTYSGEASGINISARKGSRLSNV